MQFIFRIFREGGAMMYPIVILSIFAITIILERLYYLYIRLRFNARAYFEEIKRFIIDKNINEGITYSSEFRSPVALIGEQLLRNSEQDKEILQTVTDEVFLEASPKLNRGIKALPALAQIAVLLGLLGTILGLIISFRSFTGLEVTAAVKTNYLARGISVALYTTAAGLIAATLCLLGYIPIKQKTERIISEMDTYAIKIYREIITHREHE